MRPNSIMTKQLDSLRLLRLWHWRKVEGNRGNARSYEKEAERQRAAHPGSPVAGNHATKLAKRAHGKADFHLKAVQLLNDVVSGTAEEDARGTAKVQLKA